MEFRIDPVQIQPHGIHERDARDVLNPPMSFELYRRDGIKLVSMGIYGSEAEARDAARDYAKEEEAIFL